MASDDVEPVLQTYATDVGPEPWEDADASGGRRGRRRSAPGWHGGHEDWRGGETSHEDWRGGKAGEWDGGRPRRGGAVGGCHYADPSGVLTSFLLALIVVLVVVVLVALARRACACGPSSCAVSAPYAAHGPYAPAYAAAPYAGA